MRTKKEAILIWSPLLLSFSYLIILPCTFPHIFFVPVPLFTDVFCYFLLSAILFLSFFYLLFTNLFIADICSYAPALHSYCACTSTHFQELHLLFAQNKYRKDFYLCSICQSNQVKQSHCRIRPFVSTLLYYIAAHERIL